MARILLGVAGGIAAYKTCYLLRLFTEAGHDVSVIPTHNALEFVGTTTWEALSGKPVTASVFDNVATVPHVRLGAEADLVVVAPASADLLARTASGQASDLLGNVLLTATCPVLMVPAMHTQMWSHPATTANVATLRSRGVAVMNPACGRLTGKDSGAGRMPEPEEIYATALALLANSDVLEDIAQQDLAGKRIVISAGGTREAIDPVRYLGNASSGKMGLALASAARQRGADVVLVAANISLPIPAGVDCHNVVSSKDLLDAMSELASTADIVIMAAAVADFQPEHVGAAKIKKTATQQLTLSFTQTTDILAKLSREATPSQLVIGFAAETATNMSALLKLGWEKLHRKGCQLLVLNDVTDGAIFGADETSIVVLNGASESSQPAGIAATGTKTSVAHNILSLAQQAYSQRNAVTA